ncbi:hypothetical protein EJ04DRAFT_534346 [Polyplosphaeria fusca]|uniref:Luciferase domain-containing protein n=1 Tax=Polyplosphaeria fusca TaxID=682080 RepID=A0A9P4V0I0_9PLEO|nr:hypothetical protein EJ04DRAFT_534346 [Polyplosphaeria fusca]
MVGGAAIAGSVLAAVGLGFWWDFNAWKSTGTGGTPPTLQGYLKIRRWGLWLTFNGPDLLSTSDLSASGPSYLLSPLPPRRGPRPPVTRWTLPQRQLHRTPLPPSATDHLLTLCTTLASSPTWSPYIRTAPSVTEGGTGPALYVKPDVEGRNPVAQKIFYEIAHVHPSENSLHVYVSEADARMVVESGWGMRFPVQWLAPKGWVMVWAPRDEGELEVVEGIVRAGVCFAVGRDVEKE